MTVSNSQDIQGVSQSRKSAIDNEINLADLFSKITLHKWLITIITASIFMLSVIYAFTAVPVYRANALIEVEQQKSDMNVLGLGEISNLLGENSSADKDIAVIDSYMILGYTVDKLNLNILTTPRFFPLIGEHMYQNYNGDDLAKPLFGLKSYAWGGEVIDIKKLVIHGDSSSEENHWQIDTGENNRYSLFNEHGSLILEGRIGEVASGNYNDSKVEILIDRLVARPGQSFSIRYQPRNKTIEDLKKSLKVSEVGRNTGIISLSLDGSDQKVIRNILDTVSSAYVQSNIDKHTRDSQQVIDFIDEQLPILKSELDKAQRSFQSFRQEMGTVNMEAETENALTAIMQYEKMLVEMEVEREELRRQYTENNPNVKVMDKQMEKIQGKIEKFENKIHVLPANEWEFIQKKLDVEVASALYVALLNKGQEMKVAKASTIPNVRVIDSAEILINPVKPNKPIVVAGGLIIGLLLGVGWVTLRITLHKGIEDPELIEHETGVPVFANIPHSQAENQISIKSTGKKDSRIASRKLLAFENDADLAIEAMRSFRTNMRFTMKNSKDNVIIISGPAPSIGKSFFSANYSAIAAKEGQRILLVDADMRKGHLHKQLGVDLSPGLSELITGDIPIEAAMHEVEENFFFISCGQRPPNSAELVSSKRFETLLEHFKERVDLVIFDTPPILAVTDASIIAQYGGLLFLLLRSGQHKMGEIVAATSKFKKSGVKVTGILLNDVKRKSTNYGYAYEYN